jgi:hypothetical protein
MNKFKLWFIVAIITLSGCSSNVSNSNIDLQATGKQLNLSELISKKSKNKNLFVLFEMNKKRINITEVKRSLYLYEGIDIDRKNNKLDFDKGDSLKGCLEIGPNHKYKNCSSGVFVETNFDYGSTFIWAALYPIAAVMIVSGHADDMFTKKEVDKKSILKIGAYLESELASRRQETKQALKNYNSKLLLPSKKYFLSLTTKKEVETAIQKIRTVEQLGHINKIMANLKTNEKVITTAKLNIRKKTTSRSKVVGSLKRGTFITPKSSKNGWLEVDKGWISAKYAQSVKIGYLAKLKLLSNKLYFDNKSQSLLANKNVSSSEIAKVLNNRVALKGVSATNIAKLKILKDKTIEKEKYTKAKRNNTVASYTQFLKSYPSGDYSSRARELREPLWFEQSKKQNTVQAYRYFLKEYPSSLHYNDVRNLWLELAKSQNSVSGYKNFLNGFLASTLEDKARALWFDLAKNQNSISSYRDFLNGYGKSGVEKEAMLLLEPLWYQKIATSGLYHQLIDYLSELPNSSHKTKISYVNNNCGSIANNFFTTKDNCVINYLKLDFLRKRNTFKGYAKAYALSNEEKDFNLAQKLAASKSEKQIIEYFAVLALKDKSRLFSVQLTDQHEYLGNSEHSTWLAQAKGSSSAKIKGKVKLSLKKDAPFEIKYGTYNVKTNFNLKASYAKEVRSDWVGNSNTHPVVKKSIDVEFQLSANSNVDSKKYNFGTYTIAYKDTGMMGGYTAEYLEREIEFEAYINTITPSHRLNIF